MKILGSVATAALLAFAAASDSNHGVRRGNREDERAEESSMWERILDGHSQYGSLPPRQPPANYPVLPPSYIEYTAPQPVYHATVTNPTYDHPPAPKPVYHEPPVPKPVFYAPPTPKPVYHEPPVPKPVHYAPPTPKPVYHEPPVPKPVHYAPPTPKPVYHEPPFPKPVYHAPPTPKPVEYHAPEPTYHAPVAEPTYHAPVLKPTRMTHSPERSSHYEAPSKHVPEPTYHDPESSYDGYDGPKPVYEAPKPVYEAPKPVYEAPKPVYDGPKPDYDGPKPDYDAPKPDYDKSTDPKPSVAAHEETDYHAVSEEYTVPSDSVDNHGKDYGNDDFCHVKAVVDCKDSIGGPCDQVHTPMANKCLTGEGFKALTFKYENGKCNPSANSQGDKAVCEDKGSFAFWDAVDVYCRKAGTTRNLVVEPRTVPPGGTFTISNPGGYLPEQVDCILRDQKGRIVQHNVFDATGDVDLSLMDSFGAMTVFSCAALGCLETLHYDVNIENLGVVPLDIEMVDFLLNDDKYHLLSDMEKRSLAPGESTVVTVTAEIEICKAGFSYDAYVYVEAYPANGKKCNDDIRFTFKVNIPPAPTTALPTIAVTPAPTEAPTSLSPTVSPTTLAPTEAPSTLSPTTLSPTTSPSATPTDLPSASPSLVPTNTPTASPSKTPSSYPSVSPTPAPSKTPSAEPTKAPSSVPSALPSASPTASPSSFPSLEPSSVPTATPSASPTYTPSSSPSSFPTSSPSESPTAAPSARPSNPLEGFCTIDTQVECVLSNGRPCEQAEIPHTLDCTGPSYVLHFSYQFCLCDEQANDQGDHSVCTDIAPLVEEPVTVQCAGAYGGHLYVSPHIVEPGQRFSVSTYDGSVLPKKIDCTVFDSRGRPLQRNIIDTSGAAPLTLGDKYGALQLDSCDEISCKEFFNYKVSISNIASDPALVTDATFFFNELSGDVASELGTNPLKAGQSTTLDFKFDLDICSGEDYCARIIARASPPDGKFCAAESKRTINFDPYRGGGKYGPYHPSPAYPKPHQGPYPRDPYSVPAPRDPYSVPVRAPVAAPSTDIIKAEGKCVIAEGPFAGKDPSSIKWKSHSSEIPPTRIGLLYTGEQCGSTPDCYDGPGGKPKGRVIVKASDDAPPGTIYKSVEMEIGDIFEIEAPKIGARTRLMVEGDGGSIYQTVFMDTSPRGFHLTDKYGSFKVVSFYNERQGKVSVYGKVDKVMSLSAPVIKNGESVKLLTVKEAGGPLDLSHRFKDLSIRPGRKIEKTIKNVSNGDIDLSQKHSITMTMDVTGKLLPSGAAAEGSLHSTCFIGEGSRRD